MSLDRFIAAQADCHDTALAELRAGRKRTHWMWFVLPQLRGLGTSERAVRYGIADRAEAAAYLAHPVLGPRLLASVAAATASPVGSAAALFGEVDAVKFRSCLTLFRAVAADAAPFDAALARFYAGLPCPRTLALL